MPAESTQDVQDFEAAFAERAGTDTPSEVVKDADKEPPAAPAPEPAKEQKDEPPKGESKPADPPAPQDTERKLAEALHRERSSANRLSHFMRENNQLKERVKELERENATLKAKAPAASAPAPGTKDVLAEAPELEAAVRRRVDEATAALQSQLDAANARLAEVDQTAKSAARGVEPLMSEQQQRQLNETFTQLDQAFTPEWRKTVKSADFAEWLRDQPRNVQDAYEKADTFKEAAIVLKLYYAEKGAPKPTQTDPQPGGQQVTQPAASNAEKEQERLRQAAGIAPRSNARPAPKTDDFEGAFAEFASAKAKR
jgi:hypothetical protein